MPNIHTFTIFASAPTSTAVGVASGQAVALNTNRVGLVLTNTSTGTMYLALDGATAVLNGGIVLLPSGGSWSMDEYSFSTGQVNAIAHSASSNLAIQEFTRN